MLIQFGKSDNSRVDIPYSKLDSWVSKYKFSGCHRSVYRFKSELGVCSSSMAIVDNIFTDIDKNPLEAVEKLYNYFLDYQKIFISSGNNIHFLLGIEQLPSKYAIISIRSLLSRISMELDIDFDATSMNLLQMRRVPGSINPKNGKRSMYFDPLTFEMRDTAIITGTKKYQVPLVKKRNYKWNKGYSPFGGNDNVDPFNISIDIPSGYGHHSRIYVIRQLRNRGVIMERALKFLKHWLPSEKYDHLLQEGVINRIYTRKL